MAQFAEARPTGLEIAGSPAGCSLEVRSGLITRMHAALWLSGCTLYNCPRTVPIVQIPTRRNSIQTLKFKPFDIQDLKLLDGPFKAAHEVNIAYMFRLDPERCWPPFEKMQAFQSCWNKSVFRLGEPGL